MNEVYHAKKALIKCLKVARCFETDNLNSIYKIKQI